jgi:hypothetical protein
MTFTSFLLCAECTEKYDLKQPIPMSGTFTGMVFNRNHLHAEDPFAIAIGEALTKVMVPRVQICCHVAVSLEMAFPGVGVPAQ